ncbi:tail fiber protein [Salmonella enterica]|nr:tail fiber protein [Salmonella enterica]
MLPDTGLARLPQCQSGRWGGIDSYPVGSPIPWPSTTLPPGYFLMAGQRFSCGSYPQLARAYPGCVLPDLRGVFIRGLDNGRGLDPGRSILSYQTDQSNMTASDGGALHGHHSGMTYYYPGGQEARPKNVAFNYIVKAG